MAIRKIKVKEYFNIKEWTDNGYTLEATYDCGDIETDYKVFDHKKRLMGLIITHTSDGSVKAFFPEKNVREVK